MDGIEAPAPTGIIPSWAARRRFSADDYHRMGETGIIGPADRTELIDGEIIEMAPMGSPQVGTVFALNRALTLAAPPEVVVSVQSPVRLDDRSEPEPDVALLRARADGYRQPPLPSAGDVLLVIEVSDSSLRYDQEVKLPLYARHGVPEAWIVDLGARSVEVHRAPRDGKYQTVVRLGQGDTLEPIALPGTRIAVGDLV